MILVDQPKPQTLQSFIANDYVLRGSHHAQAQTLNEAQLRRVIQCRSRRHSVRDETIILFNFYAGLRAKELAGLTRADVFDDAGAVREQFILSAAQSKGGKTRTVYLA